MAAHGGSFGAGLIKLFTLPSGAPIAEAKYGGLSKEIGSIAASPNGSKIAVLLKDPKWPLRTLSDPNVEVYETKRLSLLNRFSTGTAAQMLVFVNETKMFRLDVY